jgi:rubredoxin
MSLELEHECPECGETRTFWKVAAMNLHLGKKTKWQCGECDYGFIEIDGISTEQPA